ncbi:MAG: F0F1 ATP synthase subunit alpha, partial [Chloroflexi bacterium]|nr:F0F1 ATP synthase subunit alpha [Chloroflexota bacterium]
IIAIFAGTKGFADKVDLERMREWEETLMRYMETSHPEIGKAIVKDKRITDETEVQLRAALDAFRSAWQ